MTNTLVLGGTAWLGREVARQAIAAGHRVSCLARGNGGIIDGAELVLADRDRPDAYAEVADRRWDLVIDVSRQPGQVRAAAAALGSTLGESGRWVFVSTGSVYLAGAEHHHGDESDPVRPPTTAEVATAESYGEGKVACEQALVEVLGADRVSIARAGLIAGPGDGSDRFGYWPAAFARAAADGQAPVLVPDIGDQPIQLIDVRDTAGWLLHAGLDGHAGIFDIVGIPSTVGDVLAIARAAAGHTGETVTVSPEWLTAHQVRNWSGPTSLPLWLPDGHELSVSRPASAAVAAGLSRRPMVEMVADVLADEQHRGLDRDRAAGLSRSEEHALIDRAKSD